jgi:hypothetical protein
MRQECSVGAVLIVIGIEVFEMRVFEERQDLNYKKSLFLNCFNIIGK